MEGLVADYNSGNSSDGGSESSSESGKRDSEEHYSAQVDENETTKLPLPHILSDGSQRSDKFPEDEDTRNLSVFFNPFKADEDAKLAILEKHVKLSECLDESKTEKEKFRKKKNGQRHQNNGRSIEEDVDGFKTLGKRRIGVTNSLVPPKKSLKAYERQRQEERGRKIN